MKATKIAVDTNDSLKQIEYTHIQTGSKNICFMFSGTGYTYDKPLLYYATMVMLENQFDVVQIHYSYQKELFEQSFEDITNIIMNDVNPVINNVLANFHYNEKIFLAKSLGTIPVISEIMKKEAFSESKMILLTPLLKLDRIYEKILNSNHVGLLVIGDKDPHYNSEQVEQLAQQTSFNIKVIQGANHSLDNEKYDTLTSISSLTKVMINLKEMIS
ncbi:alpha/beta hydrolase [Solibacillus sp. R5-41]|uniref:alpha/beta family hydrolase n=1 Tax=Solibacillus sp. R5-41 TaxID=2048654 RepID=UPI000C128112|nr:alpha/beta family hydrolase [Solibacillus sp. R5-41]ATP40366.1 alpha/beta hydrolase [Solibacillus sp. R5-41]